MNAVVPPLLVLAWGNPSRGDDALGPLLAERLLAHAGAPSLVGRVEVLTDFQLQVEHALDLVGRERILFVDAALDLAEPFTVRPLQGARGGGISERDAAAHRLTIIEANCLAHPAFAETAPDRQPDSPPAALVFD